MEATGDYWKPVFYRLEAEGFECVLADARQVKNLPGRPKRDPSDSRWLASCFERGSVTSCFVATPEFRMTGDDPDLKNISIFAAVQQQLGLRLEAQKAMIEVLVIDHVEKPSAN